MKMRTPLFINVFFLLLFFYIYLFSLFKQNIFNKNIFLYYKIFKIKRKYGVSRTLINMNNVPSTVLLLLLNLFCIQALLTQTNENEWTRFKASYRRTYFNAAEESQRRAIFADNVARVADLKAQSLGYSVGLGQFADYTRDEALRLRTGLKRKTASHIAELRSKVRAHSLHGLTSLPTSYGK
jgi:hypothetical protein